MAVTSLQLTYAEIRQVLGTFTAANRTPASWSTDHAADIVNVMRKGLRKAYYPQPLGPGQPAHQWSFLRPQLSITTAEPYSIGTVTVVNGAVAGNGTTFPPTSAYYWFVCGGTYYEVASYTGGTLIQLTDTAIDFSAGSSYSLRKYKYALPADFVSLEGPLYYAADESTRFKPLEYRSDFQMRQLYQNSNTDDYAPEPKYYSVIPGSVDTTAISAWFLLMWPSPSSVFHLRGRYNIQMYDLDGTNQYPPGGAQHSEMILEACLSEAEITFLDAPGVHTQRFMELLAASISLDRQQSTPDTLGVVPLNPDRHMNTPWVSTSGYVIPDGFALSDIEA